MFASVSDDDLLKKMKDVSVEDLLLPLLVQLALIVVVARVFAVLFRRIVSVHSVFAEESLAIYRRAGGCCRACSGPLLFAIPPFPRPQSPVHASLLLARCSRRFARVNDGFSPA